MSSSYCKSSYTATASCSMHLPLDLTVARCLCAHGTTFCQRKLLCQCCSEPYALQSPMQGKQPSITSHCIEYLHLAQSPIWAYVRHDTSQCPATTQIELCECIKQLHMFRIPPCRGLMKNLGTPSIPSPWSPGPATNTYGIRGLVAPILAGMSQELPYRQCSQQPLF